MTLKIPTVESDGTFENIYIVKSGDSLYKIANMYGMTVNELKTLNNLTSNTLSIGQKLKVLESEPMDSNTYTVKSGDSLYSIARKYGLTVDALKQANNKASNLLSIGEVLIIPDPSQGIVHVVMPGDTLWSVARRYNTTVDNIKRLNNLGNNILTIGMTLRIS